MPLLRRGPEKCIQPFFQFTRDLRICDKVSLVAPVGSPPRPSLSPDSDGYHRGDHWRLRSVQLHFPVIDITTRFLIASLTKCRSSKTISRRWYMIAGGPLVCSCPPWLIGLDRNLVGISCIPSSAHFSIRCFSCCPQDRRGFTVSMGS